MPQILVRNLGRFFVGFRRQSGIARSRQAFAIEGGRTVLRQLSLSRNRSSKSNPLEIEPAVPVGEAFLASHYAVAGQAAVGRAESSQPADSQERGTENSDQPQSRQMRTSGEGVSGGWLNVRGLFR
jgi:hypothetical protein